MPRKATIKAPVVQKVVRKKYTVPVKLPPTKDLIPVRLNRLPQTNKELQSRIKEPDPIITILQNVIDEAFPGRTRKAYINASVKAMVCFTTIKKLMEGRTSRPWHSTVKAILSACGYEYLVNKKGATA